MNRPSETNGTPPSAQSDRSSHAVLVVGLGFVGSCLASRLVRAGHSVFGLKRSERPVPEGVHDVRADVTRTETLRATPNAVDTIVYAVSPSSRSPAAYEDCYVRGLENMAGRHPKSRLLLVSTTAVYGVDDGRLVDDETETSPMAPTAQLVARGERLLTQHAGPTLVVRASGIYGPGRTRLLSRLWADELTADERGRWTNRIHRDDLAAILERAIEEEWTGSLIASDAEPARLGTIQDWVRAELGQPNQRPITVESGRARTRQSRRFVASRLRSLGYDYLFPSYRDGYTPLLGSLTESADSP